MAEREIDDLEQERTDWLVKGLQAGKVFPYPDSVFDCLRPYSFGGLPVSIMLFITELNNGYCYDRAKLMQLAFDDCRMVYADIESLRRDYGAERAEHAYLETKDFGGGKTWVVDTSAGLIYEKAYYDEYEKPQVKRVFTKKECMQSQEIQDILAADFEKDKWSLVLTLPVIEHRIAHSDNLGTVIYREKLQEEIAKLKAAINFEAMQKEVAADIELSQTDPAALDKKFQVVRDEHCQVISRGGVKNPYYSKLGKRDLQMMKDAKNDLDLCKKLLPKIIKEHRKEEAKVRKKAVLKLKAVTKNPRQNVYEQ